MSNYKDYLIGASGGAYVPPYEQSWTKVATSAGWINSSSYPQQSSTTYQAFQRLATKGLYGGLFDPYNSSNSQGRLTSRSFKVDQSTGAITVNGANELWSHGYGQIFSTCHFGAVGHTVMNIGHNKSPSYGSTSKGWIFAVEFDTNGNYENYGNSGAPINMWPHSNGNLVMSTTASKDATVYGRRSTYNQSDGKYWHQRGQSTNGSVQYSDYQNPSSGTSTNYAYGNAMNAYNDLAYCGWVGWQDNGGNGVWTPINSSGDRVGNYSSSTYFGQNDIPSYIKGYHLANGEYLYVNSNNNWWVKCNSSNQPVAGQYNGDTAPSNISLLAIGSNVDMQPSTYIPLGSNAWLMPNSVLGGFLKISIDPSSNYAVSISKHYSTLLSGMGLNPSHSGETFDVTGSTDQFFVHAKVSGAYYTINVFNNPYV
tara:strand:- start:2785 stop:4056 length:1272 start_codon:yes stop_codon:yes gene_type:complete